MANDYKHSTGRWRHHRGHQRSWRHLRRHQRSDCARRRMRCTGQPGLRSAKQATEEDSIHGL